MKNKSIIISTIVALIVGFFIGQEYTKYSIRQSLSDVFSDMGSVESDTLTDSSVKEEVKKMNNITVAVGDVVELVTLEYMVNSSEEKEMIKSNYGQPHLATEGTKFVVVNLTITNSTSETFDFDDDTLQIEDASGDFYKPYGDTIGNIDDYLAWKELSPNIPVTGVVVFQLPNSVESYELLSAKANSNDLFRVKLQ